MFEGTFRTHAPEPEDSVGFFNWVTGVRLTTEEKQAGVAVLRTL